MTGDGWMTGRTLYYALRLNDLQRFPIPEITSPIVLKIASLGVLIIESSFGILIWFKNFRAVILALGVCLHLTIEYSMNIPLFEWIMIAMYLTFLDPADLSQVWSHIKNRAVAHVKTGPTLLVDYKYSRCKKIADVISVLNIFGLINIEDIENGNATNLQRDCNPDRFTQSRMLTDGRLMGIVATIVSISPFIPLLWFLCPVRWVQTNLNWPATSDAAARS